MQKICLHRSVAIEFSGVADPTYYSLRPTGSLLMLEPEHHVVRLHFASHREQIILMQWADEVDTQPRQLVARVTRAVFDLCNVSYCSKF